MHSLGSQGISLFILVAHIVGHFLAGSLHLLPCVFELMKGGGLGLDIGLHVGVDISPLYRSSPDFSGWRAARSTAMERAGFRSMLKL